MPLGPIATQVYAVAPASTVDPKATIVGTSSKPTVHRQPSQLRLPLVYSLRVDQPITVILRPMGDAQYLRVDGGQLQQEAQLLLQPGHEYVVTSER
jgi:hypothetical protein